MHTPIVHDGCDLTVLKIGILLANRRQTSILLLTWSQQLLLRPITSLACIRSSTLSLPWLSLSLILTGLVYLLVILSIAIAAYPVQTQYDDADHDGRHTYHQKCNQQPRSHILTVCWVYYGTHNSAVQRIWRSWLFHLLTLILTLFRWIFLAFL